MKISKDKITKEGDNLIISIPLKQRRWNPYQDMATGDGDVGEMNNLIGVVCGDDMGFAQLIDMDYKGKSDQIGAFVFMWFGEEKELEEMCDKFGIDFFKYPICGTCNNPIFGSFYLGAGGKKVCYGCDIRNNIDKDFEG